MKKRILAVILSAVMLTGSAAPAGQNVYAAEAETAAAEAESEQEAETELEQADTAEMAAAEAESEQEAETESEQADTAETVATEAESEQADTTETSETALPTGLMEETVIDESYIAPWQVCDLSKLSVTKPNTDGTFSVVYNNEWDKYGSNYYLNQMTDGEREAFENLYALCMEYLTTEKDATAIEYNGKTCYRTEYVSCGSLSYSKVHDIAALIRAMYPQFYFLSTTTWRSSMSGTAYAALGFYQSFADGETRAAETAKFKSTADAMIAGAQAYQTEEEKLKYLHDAIVTKVEYDHDIVKLSGDERSAQEEVKYTQSAYSVFCTDTTVCAGYAQALAMVCNGAGVDALAVSGNGHRWNMVRINDSWYNVDPTWADKGTGKAISYKYYGRSSEAYANDNSTNVKSHTVVTRDAQYIPPCILDTGNTYYTCNAFPNPTESAIAPVISIQPNGENYLVTLTSQTEDAFIYYTQNGDTPSSSATRCYRYEEPFTTDSLADVKAIAVCDAYLDSDVTTDSIEPLVLSFNGNGASTGNMSGVEFLSGVLLNLSQNTYARNAYTFAGWNTKADGTGEAYADMAQVDTSAWTGNVTLYAQWTPITYHIYYELNGGANNAGNPATYTTTAAVNLNAPERTGYNFDGWYTDSSYQNKVTNIPTGSMGDVTFYAKWSVVNYSIAYNLNGGTNNSNPTSYNIEFSVTLSSPEKNGYTFDGWYKESDFKTKVTSIEAGNTGNLTLFAKWTETKYKIKYSLSGGKNDADNPTAYTINTKVSLKAPTRKGYTFAGWYTDASYKKKITKISKGTTGNITLYAKWNANEYKIVYKGNGSTSGKMSNTSCKYGTSYKLTANKFKKKGYTFVGWNTKADGSGTTYKNKASIKNLTATSNKKVTLYAQWKKTKYTVTYKLNGGKNNKKNPTSYYITTSTKTLKNPTRKGYTFEGWYTDKKFKNKVTKIKKGSTGNITLYAKWKKK